MDNSHAVAVDAPVPSTASSRSGAPHPADSLLGTVMWVGERDRTEFRDAYRFCEQHAAQLALRRDLADAVARPAAAVERIVVLCQNRQDLHRPLQLQLAECYPEASLVQLLGPLCAGAAPSRLEPFGTRRFYWHQANQVLPGWFRGGLESRPEEPAPAVGLARSVAVIASNDATAEPLLDLAASAGATALWCRRADRFRIRNVDLFWWDDSAAPPASADVWRERLGSVATGAPAAPRHAWLAGGPTAAQCRDALAAGVEAVITKPAQIHRLLETIQGARGGSAGAEHLPGQQTLAPGGSLSPAANAARRLTAAA